MIKLIRMLIIVAVCLCPAYAETLVIAGSGTDLGTFKLLGRAYMQQNPGVSVKVLPSLGSGGGLKALKKKRISIALLSRPIKPKEQTVTMKVLHYAYTPLVLAVSTSTKVSNIRSEDVFNIYTGELKYWPDGSVIRPVFRPLTDSDSKLLLAHIGECEPCLRKGLQRHGIPVAMSDQQSAEMISRIPGGFGTSTMSLILSERRMIKALTFNGVEPTAENVLNQTYPMYKDLYMAFRQDSASMEVFRFVDFVLSDKGKAILEQTGHAVVRGEQ